MHKENLLDTLEAGYEFHGYDRNNKFCTLKKFHYFENGKSLCGKYRALNNACFLSGGLYSDEICQKCRKILKERQEIRDFVSSLRRD